VTYPNGLQPRLTYDPLNRLNSMDAEGATTGMARNEWFVIKDDAARLLKTLKEFGISVP
jgi:hypothetical protein